MGSFICCATSGVGCSGQENVMEVQRSRERGVSSQKVEHLPLVCVLEGLKPVFSLPVMW